MLYNFQYIYEAIILNKKKTLELHGEHESRVFFIFKSMVYFGVVLFKIILSKFIFFSHIQIPNDKVIAFNWSRFKSRLTDYNNDSQVFDYYFNKFDLEQIRLFKYVCLFNVFKLTFSINTEFAKGTINRDNFFFRFVCAAEYLMYESLIKSADPKEVVVAGLNDRHTFYISEICKSSNIFYTMVQHGCLFALDNPRKCFVNKFVYCFDFSIPFLKYYLLDNDTIQLKFLKLNKSPLQTTESGSNLDLIGFACMPTNVKLNIDVIDFLIENLSNKYNIAVFPHPREDKSIYSIRYKKDPKVMISEQKFSDIKVLVSRVSTLGVDYADIGCEVIFVNFEGSSTDYLNTGRFEVVSNLESLKPFVSSL